jgi:hypothetical protein
VNNAWTMPQERYNADWIREQRLGIVIGSFRGVDSAVAQLQDGLDAYRARVDRIQNRALFEIPDILAALLQSGALHHSRSEKRCNPRGTAGPALPDGQCRPP